MSDYLENLVAKSRNRANVIQPRPASLFEPSSPDGPLAADPFAADFTPEGERFASEIQDDRARSAPAPGLQPGSARPTVASVGRTDRVLPLPTTDIGTQKTHQAPMSVAATSSLTPVFDPVTIRRAPPETPGAETVRLRSRPTEHADSFAPANKLPPVTVVTSHERGAPLRGPSALARSETSTAEGVGPTIKISIGRVDVRAIMPTSRAARPTSTRKGPSLSLDDYLKRHDQGKS